MSSRRSCRCCCTANNSRPVLPVVRAHLCQPLFKKRQFVAQVGVMLFDDVIGEFAQAAVFNRRKAWFVCPFGNSLHLQCRRHAPHRLSDLRHTSPRT